MNYGFKQPEIKVEDHIFGVANLGQILNETGQWDRWLPETEYQARFFETQSCTSYGTLSAIEIMLNMLYNE